MLKDQVLTEWTNLKEQINDLKLSEKDKQTIDYLQNHCPIELRSSVEFVTDERLTSLEQEIETNQEILNEILKSYSLAGKKIIGEWALMVLRHTETILAWISLKKTLNQMRDCIDEERQTNHKLKQELERQKRLGIK